MSKSRIEAKVRKNPDFEAMAAFLDGLGLKWEVHATKGHPRLHVILPGGRVFEHAFACTPHTRRPPAAEVSHLKKRLIEALSR